MFNYEDCVTEEASYWFCVQEVSEFVQLLGFERVMKDVLSQLDKDRQVQYTNNSQPLEDVPF